MSTYPRSQFDIVEGFWQQLVQVDDRLLRDARRAEARRRRRRTLALAALLLLALVAIGLAARALFGSDAPRVFQRPESVGAGAARASTLHLLPIRQADPQGGPPWGLRVFVTSKRRRCFQTGRVVRGRLVALGVDGAFGNDGRAHRLPVEFESCGGIARNGAVRFSAVSSVETRSGLPVQRDCLAPQAEELLRRGPQDIRQFIAAARERGDAAAVRMGRLKLREAQAAKLHAPPPCAPQDLRTVIVGTSGHGAESVSLRAGPVRRTVRVGDDPMGAYLFVLVGAPPETAMLTAHLRSGATCPLRPPLGLYVRPKDLPRPCLRAGL